MQGLPFEPSVAGFVFKTEEIETECRRLEAKIAQDCNYDPERFRQQLAAA